MYIIFETYAITTYVISPTPTPINSLPISNHQASFKQKIKFIDHIKEYFSKQYKHEMINFSSTN